MNWAEKQPNDIGNNTYLHEEATTVQEDHTSVYVFVVSSRETCYGAVTQPKVRVARETYYQTRAFKQVIRELLRKACLYPITPKRPNALPTVQG